MALMLILKFMSVTTALRMSAVVDQGSVTFSYVFSVVPHLSVIVASSAHAPVVMANSATSVIRYLDIVFI